MRTRGGRPGGGTKKGAQTAVEQSAEITRIIQAAERASGVDLEALETALRDAVHAAGAKVLEALLEQVGVGRREEAVRCPRCGGVMDSRGLKTKTIATLPNLRFLNLEETQGITDVSMFKNLARIGELYLRHKKDQFPQEQVDLLNRVKEAAKKPKKLFEDHFKNNRNKWVEADNENSMLKVDDGKYVFEHKREKGSWLVWNPIDIEPDNDFQIEATISKVQGGNTNGYGIVWGLKDVKNRYQFLVNGNGSYTYAKTIDGKWETLIEWTAFQYTNKDNATNTLMVRKVGSQIKFYINNRYVTEAEFEDFFDQKVGFFVYGPLKVEIDHLLVKN